MIDEKFFLDQGYLEVRKLDDGNYIGLGKLIFTTAIYVDLDAIGYHKRYCFKDSDVAKREFEKMSSVEDEPTGYLAKRAY